MAPELIGPRGHLPVDHPDHRVRELRVIADQPLVRRDRLRPVLLRRQPGRRVRAHRVVHAEPLPAHPLDQARLPQLLQRAQRRLLRYVGQRGRGRPAEGGPPGQRQPPQQPARGRGQPRIGGPQGALHRVPLGGVGRPAPAAERSQHPQRERQPAAQLDGGGHGCFSRLRCGRGADQLRRLRVRQPLHRQLVHPGRQIRRKGDRLPRRHQHQALGTLRHQHPHLRRVHRVVQDHRHRQPLEVLVVQLAEPPHLLLRRGPLAEQQLLTGRPQPVQQVQQRLPSRQRRTARVPAPQVHHARAPELVPQPVRRPQRQRRTAHPRLPVQHHDHRAGLRTGPGRLHPLRDPGQLRLPARERARRVRELPEGLLQHAAPPGLRAAVRTAQRRNGPGRGSRRPGRGRHRALLLQEGPYAAHLQSRQPLQPQLLGAARAAPLAGPPVRRRQVQGRHLGHRRHRPRDARHGPGGQRLAGSHTERQIRPDGRSRRNSRDQQGG